jgi:hypothetical protein
MNMVRMNTIRLTVRDPEKDPPPPGGPVIISGGPAMWLGGRWVTVTHPHQEVRRKVTWWAHFPRGGHP